MNFYYVLFANNEATHIYANSKKELLDELNNKEEYRKNGKYVSIAKLGLSRGSHVNPND